MDMDEPQEQDAGIPAWVMTFADLMSLLMCFFVLLLAFSEMDAQKFKQLSGSMKEAFGVQAELKADYIPKGTSVVTTEFSPGRPDPTSLDSMRQHTMDTTKSTLEFSEGDGKKEADLKEALEKLKKELSEEIEDGKLSVRRENGRIIIQIHEQGSFASGYAEVEKEFLPTLDKIGALCAEMEGIVQVTGHTDDVPIATPRFRSNWDLSSSRAVTVAHRLLKNKALDPRRIVISGLAWTQPLAANDSRENRALNRRVEISILQTIDEEVPATTSDDAITDSADGEPESNEAANDNPSSQEQIPT